jgi:hypothetical protein
MVKYYYKLWQKNEIESPLTFEDIKKIDDKRIQIFNLKTGWHWVADFERLFLPHKK